MKWGAKFDAADVNRLHRMIARYLDDAFTLTCLTDDAQGIDATIRCMALPDVPIVGHRHDRGWRKLGLFGPELAKALHGPALYLDLDIAITGPLTPFFDAEGDFLIIKDYRAFRYRHRQTGNSSVIRFVPGAHDGLLAEVDARGEGIRSDFRDEQEFLSDYMRRAGLLRYWPRAWCPSFKHDCVRRLPFGLWREPRLPADARIVVFHGRPKPDDALVGTGSKWYRPLKPAPWLQHYLD